MKAITKTETKVKGNKITITGELMDITQPIFYGQRSTILHPVNGDMNHPRHFQVNSHGTMVLRNGTDGVLFPKDEMVAIAIEIDSALTNPPKFDEHPSEKSIIGKVRSEIPIKATIEESEDGKTWKEVKDAGKDFKPSKGKHYRCVAENAKGKTVSNAVKI